MTGRVQDKVAIITGAGASGPGWGNGKASAVLYAREGAKIFAVDLDEAAAASTTAIVEEEGGNAVAFKADVADADQVEAMVAACVETFGRIDILHNNVGILELGGPVEASEESWERVMAINLRSQFLTHKHVLPVMQRQSPNAHGLRGAIVNIGSVSGSRWTGVSYISYSTTKGAIVPFTRSVALQYAGQGIRANAILPGLMNTPMIVEPLKDSYGDGGVEEMIRVRDAQCPMGHMGDAWDVAHAALFLASDEARYITGTTLVVDGGLSAKLA
ncbi:MAG: SDR family NAD(P)-dependent oxidoreductase [Alphaproteobacteria bacterium]|nr:SDR family NAD(P)-dependent oxidoreductase [Alphaproteobacteria bacterium]